MEITLMESYDQDIGLLLAEKVYDCFHWRPFDQMTLESDAVTLDLGSCLVLKFCTKLQPVRLKHLRHRAIGSLSKGGIRG